MEPQPMSVEEEATVQQSEAVPAGSLAPLISGVVVDLRGGWLADVIESPERHTPPKLTWQDKLRRRLGRLRGDMDFERGFSKDVDPIPPPPPKPVRQPRRSLASVAARDKRTDIIERILAVAVAFAFAVGLLLFLAIRAGFLNPQAFAELLRR
jgi:hypothetical protein